MAKPSLSAVWILVVGASLGIAQPASQPAGRAGSASPDLQTLLDKITGRQEKTVRRLDAPSAGDFALSGPILGGDAPWNRRVEVGTVQEARLHETFDTAAWRLQCHAYQGVTHFDGEALNFTYGGEGRKVVYEFESPATQLGGSVRFDMLFSNADAISIGIAERGKEVFTVKPIQEDNRVIAFLPKTQSPAWVVLDGSVGRGAVIDNLDIQFGFARQADGTPALRPQDLGLPPVGQLEYDRDGRPLVRVSLGEEEIEPEEAPPAPEEETKTEAQPIAEEEALEEEPADDVNADEAGDEEAVDQPALEMEDEETDETEY